ncbi:hypothetical protein [Acinetobacter radioresistens]|uniref:hypothetical protein n=1 Tax=Acinetobacter radioresistens TaxID=40216 RepID=UPI0011634CE6|nr:hypothetical protein [Acinetobacter radioresistens]BBL21146.1 hypothetical protein ACRAD_18170 [Acinetobacter radioresistens DSM 6976 = NBRC 102413 = CIP 103788]
MILVLRRMIAKTGRTSVKEVNEWIGGHEMEWSFNKPMSIKEVINGAKHIKVESDGIKTRWQGVSKQWLDAVDEDLKGLTAVSAWATATCVGMVEQRNPAAVLLGKMISWGATA